jgi:hypothetical protein
MKSAFECYQHAAKCERMAKEALDTASRRMLRTTAEHWRTLGNAAKANEGREAQDPLPETQSD